ncbi:beta-galactosidase GalA [Chthonomonas calidirosea]|uniref:beta-galactosidase GalA n=1 Tax=Chthonomonas calidirosea TaxID=454171 RepID=UPI001E343531|nr:beta-galactosidase GalA [Chthonomonas calidirosea]
MMKVQKALVLLPLAVALSLPSPAFATHRARAESPFGERQKILFDANWRFFREPTPHLEKTVPITDWVYLPIEEGAGDARVLADPNLDTSAGGWKPVKTGTDVFEGRVGFAWFRTTLPPIAPPPKGYSLYLLFENVDDNGTVYLNGKKLYYHEGYGEPFVVPLAEAWRSNGPNLLAVQVDNAGGGPGGILGDVFLGYAKGADIGSGAAQPDFNDSSWRIVHLPHDYVIEGRFDPKASVSHGFLPTPPAWYRKTFYLPASDRGKSLWLYFEGVFRDSDVWLNGKFLGNHPSGYTSFFYNIAKAAHFGGKNVLAVHVDPGNYEGWWYEGGGIYRHVWLIVTNPVHIAQWTTFVNPQVVGDDVEHPAMAQVNVHTTVENDTDAEAACRLQFRVLDAENHLVAQTDSTVSIPPNGTRKVAVLLPLHAPHLWSLESPYLYKLQISVLRDGRIVDGNETNFGVRTIRFDPNQGFFLNGKHVELQGTCNHQDFAGVGIGMPDSLLEWRIRKLKEMGSNAYRCSHNPPAPELLDACDRIGMLVMDENRHLGDVYTPKTPPNAPYSDLSDLASMVRRDRNHPCIILWSLCNEEGIQGTPAGERMGAAMKKVVESLDPTRPVTAAMNGGWGYGLSHVLDVQGINYSYGVYDSFHQSHPDFPIVGSEIGSDVSDRGIYANDPAKGYVSAYNNAENTWKSVATHPFVAGGFVWTGFDYKGEPSPYGWPCVNSHFGLMDLCGFPKDDYYYYKAWWDQEHPLVHLFPHWNWQGKEGQPIDVWCYSNCDAVELFLNGKSLGKKEMPKYWHVEWHVPYSPGVLEARGYRDGQVVATDRVETTGPPAAIRLTTSTPTIKADGEEVGIVEVAIVDAQGRVVPTADNLVHFRVRGAGSIAGVGNGDPSDHEPDQANYRHAFNGLCLLVVRAGNRPGSIEVEATSEGLRSAHLRLDAVR